jgi:hypothetical protein
MACKLFKMIVLFHIIKCEIRQRKKEKLKTNG